MSDETPLHSGPLDDGPIDGTISSDHAVPINPIGSESPKVVGYCRACGTALTEATVRVAQGSIFCAGHVPVATPPPPGANPPGGMDYPPPNSAPNYSPRTDPRYADSPYSSTAPVTNSDANPVAAFWLGLIPGVGAIYNGQYAKGMSHVVIFGLLISLVDVVHGSLEPLFAMLIPAFVFYMAFEAHHTARNRRDGLPVDEFSSLAPGHSAGHDRFPVAPVILIVAGVVFLLDSLEIFQIQRLEKFWPVLLIVLGAYLLYSRTAGWTAPNSESYRPPSQVYTGTSAPVPEAKSSAKREAAEPAPSERI